MITPGVIRPSRLSGTRIVLVKAAPRHKAPFVIGAAAPARRVSGVGDPVDTAEADVAVMAVEAGDARDVAVAGGAGRTGKGVGPYLIAAVAGVVAGARVAGGPGVALGADDIRVDRMHD